jgi:hypothetical protein
MSSQPLDYRTPNTGAERPNCIACGSDQVIKGKLTGVNFRPDKLRRLLSFRSIVRVVGVDAYACTACGTVQMRIDPVSLMKMAGDPSDGNPTAT